ncbi:MAG: hypothetical protein SVX43_19960, partial [Cyanobacteriota bacterium]|nr:hypothetical protein [Cyanobacteriota bacterium]
VLPVGVAEAGAWRYAFVYELLPRWFSEIPELARTIGRGEASGLSFSTMGTKEPDRVVAFVSLRPPATVEERNWGGWIQCFFFALLGLCQKKLEALARMIKYLF